MDVTGLGAGVSFRMKLESSSKAADERHAKRLEKMEEALKRLQEMPSPAEMAKQEALNKAAMLKQRLEALKAMLLHASPEQARALARELKSIAKALSSLAQSVGGAQGGTSAQAVVSPGDESGALDAEGTPVVASTVPAEAAADSEGNSGQYAGSQEKMQVEPGESSSIQGADEKQGASNNDDLKAALEEAAKLLKEAIRMLRAKLADAADQVRESREEEQARREVQSAERDLSEVDRALSSPPGGSLYTIQGDLGGALAGDGFALSAAVTGQSVDVSA